MVRLVGWLALTVFAGDQLTKWWAGRVLVPGESHPVLPGIFHLTLVRNTGVAFGLFAHAGMIVLIVTAGIVAVLVITSMRRPPISPLVSVAMGLVLGGATGNLLDRLRLGAVIDFLDFRVWPVFNVADSCITVGAVLLAWVWSQSRWPEGRGPASSCRSQ